jgi:inner membrane protein
MKNPLLARFLAVTGITILLVAPLVRIAVLVEERSARRAEAVADIARGSGGAQLVTGPLLVVPVTHVRRETVVDAATGRSEIRESRRDELLHILPEQLDAQARFTTELRYRGIHDVRVYRTLLKLQGSFATAEALQDAADGELRLGQPWIAFGIGDARGIGAGLSLSVDGAPLRLEAGSRVTFLPGGVHAPVGAAGRLPARLAFAAELPLQGTERFEFVPAGRETRLRLSSDWPHPGFVGDLLPTTRTVRDDGFDASWDVSFLATDVPGRIAACAAGSECRQLDAARVGVAFTDPTDHYARVERAVKYALLFIALTFVAFLLCEVLLPVAVHPVQYGLVGLALALFFLLLLSLSEQFGFAVAYATSALACCGLLGWYVTKMLGGRARGALFTTALAAVYGLLYAILAAEDYALLLGSLLLFAALALVMITTRDVDWSRHGRGPAA